MNVPARDLWTGDLLVLRGKTVTKLQPVAEGGLIRVTTADVVVVSGDPPLEINNETEVVFSANEAVTIMRDHPLANGMHMTQLDLAGMCHGRAHPALEQRFRREGKLAKDYTRG
jgi:hypothetical protein